MSQRSALVVAIDQYQDPMLSQLRTPTNDAGALAEVLADPAIGDFDVHAVLNPAEGRLRQELAHFFANRGRDDLLLLYISCHGMKDMRGQLYFAASDTSVDRLSATATSAAFINDLMDQCRSQAIVLVLDCCYSGAFSRGMTVKGDATVHLVEEFRGARVVITSSSATEYAFEGEQWTGEGELSVFTSALVRGLRTGEADLNGDGLISAQEIYSYADQRVRELTPNQTPMIWMSNLSGDVVIARVPDGSRALRVPEHILQDLASDRAALRLEGIDRLAKLIPNASPQFLAAVRSVVRPLTNDDSVRVSEAAEQLRTLLLDVAERSAVTPETEAEPAEEAEEKYTAEPIVSNDYWTTGDQLDYEPYADAIAEFIQHEETAPPLTIGIKGAWGAGKTSLMRMIQDRLDPIVGPPTASGELRRQAVTLTDASKTKVLGFPWWKRLVRNNISVTNGTVLRKLRRRAHAAGDPRLSIDPPREPSWRPTVWFNPWMYQNGEQIWAGLAHEIISQVTSRMPASEREAFWLELNIRRVDTEAVRRRVYRALLERLVPLVIAVVTTGLLAVGIYVTREVVPAAAGLLENIARGVLATGTLGTVLAGITRTAAFWRERAGGVMPDLTHQPDYLGGVQRFASEGLNTVYQAQGPGYDSRLGFLHLVQADMRQVLNLVATGRRPLVIFVDDLDRCSPGTVAHVIEAINLFLAGQFPNCVFILAMEPEMVAAHIEVAYQPLVETLAGEDYWGEAHTLGWRFLDKIVQLPISLPVLRSSQTSQFLGNSLVGERRQVQTGAQPELDPEAVRRIEDSLRQQRPTLDDIGSAARIAQERVTGVRSGAGPLTAETQTAARRELRRRLRADNPEVQAIVAAVAGRLAKNPREIKRFVNVFRFYMVVRQEREAAGMPVPDSLTEVAKLAVIAVRWPHLRNALGRQIGPTERDTVLALLEAPLADLPDGADRTMRREALRSSLTAAQLPPRLCENLLASEELCDLLTHGPAIGTAAVGYL